MKCCVERTAILTLVQDNVSIMHCSKSDIWVILKQMKYNNNNNNNNNSNQGIITSVFHNFHSFYSFVPFSYKLELLRTLVDRIFKINNTWADFHLDINSLTTTLRRNLFPSSVIEIIVRKFLNTRFTSDSSQSAARKENVLYFKLRTSVHFPSQRHYAELRN